MKTLTIIAGCIVLGLCGCMSVGPQDVDAAIAKYVQVRAGMNREEVVGLLGAPQSEDKGGARWAVASSDGRQSASLLVSFRPDGRVAGVSRQFHAEDREGAVPVDIGPVAAAH